MCMYVCIVCVRMHVHTHVICVAGTFGNQTKVSDILELELQEVVNLLIWVLGPKFRSSGGAASVLKSGIISLAPSYPLLIGF